MPVLRLDPAGPARRRRSTTGSSGAGPTRTRAGRRSRVRDGAVLLAAPVVRPVITMDQLAGPNAMSRLWFLGAVPARLVPDNLKTGVERPDLYDPRINRSYADAQTVRRPGDPARSRKPRDKARVERPMPISGTRSGGAGSSRRWSRCRRKRPLVRGGRRRRACGPLDGAAPAAVFEAAEKDTLAPLPKGPFVLADWSPRRSSPDIHVQAGRMLYSVPWKHIGKTLDVRPTATMVQFFIGGELVKTHLRKPQASRPTWVTSYQLLGISRAGRWAPVRSRR